MKTHEDALKPNNSNTEEDQEAVTQAFDEEAKKKGLTFYKIICSRPQTFGRRLNFS